VFPIITPGETGVSRARAGHGMRSLRS
jgi:hypothetical protein